MTSGGDLVFVGDAHLDRGQPAVERFLGFLERLAGSTSRLVVLGDLFNLWIGRAWYEQPHHVVVADKLASLRRRGVVVRYVEGNRDYRIADRYLGTAFDDVTRTTLVERFGGHDILVAHGDLANVADRQYRAWRRVSRNGIFWAALNLLPRARRRRFADDLEARLRRTNLAHKQVFPEAEIRAYSRGFFAHGHDTVVLGHFHVERTLTVSGGRRILVLPLWPDGPRHLRVTPAGDIAFVDSCRGGGGRRGSQPGSASD